MNNYKKIFVLAVVCLALTRAAGVAHAQTVLSAPIVVRSLGGSSPANSGGQVWLPAEVIHADSHSMLVREQGNERMIHTFTYAEGLQAKMQQIADAGGYQYGDKVKILYQRGQSVALKIHGRPSKPL
jgi:hypothetical protein